MIRLLLILTALFASTVDAATYYVSNSTNTDGGGTYTCSDTLNTGTSPTAPWCTVAKVNSTSFTTGDDVYFRAGSTWRETLTVDWAGNAGNRATIGTYYMSGGSAVIGELPSQYSTYHQKAIIEGNYSQDTGGAPDAFLGTASAIPSSIYSSMITVSANYVTVQNLYVRHSAARAIVVGAYSNAILENNEIYYTAMALISVDSGSTNVIVRNNIAGHSSQGKYNYDRSGTGWSGGIFLSNSDEALVEGNIVYNTYGEALNVYAGTENAIIRGNIVTGNRSLCVYVDGGANALIEQNYCLASEYNYGEATAGHKSNFWNTNYPGYSTGIEVNIEDGNTFAISSTKILIRNNILYRNVNCIKVNLGTALATANTYDVGAYIYGNTCLSPGEAGIEIDNDLADNDIDDTIEIMRNIVEAPTPVSGTAVANICKTGSVTSAKITMDDNLWGANPSDSDCDDADDEYGTADFFQNDFTNYSQTALPSDLDFELQTGSTGKDTGGAISTSISSWLNTTNFPQYASMATPCSTFDTTKMSYDFNCVARNASSEKGAIDGITSITPTVTVPYKMKAGGSASGWDDEVTAYRVVGACTSYTSSTATAITGNITYADDVFQSSRGCNGPLAYEIPIANATYDLTLPFTEHYWGVTSGSCGARKFDIYVENILVADEFDICSLTSNVPLAAVEKAVNAVVVSDGYLSVRLEKGSTGTDNKPVFLGVHIVAAAGDTVSIGSSTVTTTVNNNHPNTNTIDPVSLCSATTSLSSIYTSSINTAGLTSGSAALDNNIIDYTPANAAVTGAVGSFVATISDGSDTATCTVSITLQDIPEFAFLIKRNSTTPAASITTWCWTFEDATTGATVAKTDAAGQTCDGATDSSGLLTISDSRLTRGAVGTVTVFTNDTTQVGGSSIYRVPFLKKGVTVR